MKFGFGHIPGEHYLKHTALVQTAEGLGYDFAWIPDQTFYRDPYLIMASAASVTESIHIGVGVTNPYTRHPAMTARTIATLDEFAPGRIHLGIGAGNRKELLNPLGDEGSQAGARCREMVLLVRELLSGKKSHYQGEYYQCLDVAMDFEPNPDIPLHIAGRGPLVLRAAGEVADGVIIGGLCTPLGISYALEQVKKGADAAGRSISDLNVVSWVMVRVTHDREATAKSMKPMIAHIVGGAPMSVLEAVDLPLDLIETIKSTYHNEGILQAAELVTYECIDAFTLIGDASQLTARIQDLGEAGVTQLAVLLPAGTVDHHHTTLLEFAESIFPAFT